MPIRKVPKILKNINKGVFWIQHKALNCWTFECMFLLTLENYIGHEGKNLKKKQKNFFQRYFFSTIISIGMKMYLWWYMQAWGENQFNMADALGTNESTSWNCGDYHIQKASSRLCWCLLFTLTSWRITLKCAFLKIKFYIFMFCAGFFKLFEK